MQVSVVLALPDEQRLVELDVTLGTTAREAFNKAMEQGLEFTGSDVEPGAAVIGVYGETVPDEHVLAEFDRVEIYRPLQQDPKQLRRQRAEEARLGARSKNP